MRIDGKTETPRQSMSWLHGWLGILAGCLLYVIFFTGSLSFYQKQLNLWLQPELHQSLLNSTQQQQLNFALAQLNKTDPQASSWQIMLPNTAQPTINVSSLAHGELPTRHEKPKQTLLDATTGQVLTPRNTAGAEFISVLHFQLYGLPHVLGRWIVGLATLLMLVALMSGIVIHKKIFKEFFVFRRGKGLRSWLDGHNLAAVYSVPFQLMISFSGLLLLAYTLMPWAIDQVYPQGKSAFVAALQQEQLGQQQTTKLTLQPQHKALDDLSVKSQLEFKHMPDLTMLLTQVQQQWPDNPVAAVLIKNPNTAQAQIEFRARYSEDLFKLKSVPSLKFNAITGTALPTTEMHTPVAAYIYNFMLALHRASGSDAALRALLFFSGLMGLLMIVSGQVLWVVKKQGMSKAQNNNYGLRLMQCCNVAVILGLILACVGYLYAARLIPSQVTERRELEIQIFFIVWLLSFIHAAFRKHRQAWLEQLVLLAVLLSLLPVLNALSGGMPLWLSLSLGQSAVAGIDLAAMVFAIIIIFIFYHLKRHQGQPRSKAKARVTTTDAREQR
ncbi:PepSY-associated TM helix domain-containing protein [Acinetobacter rudis]|uniref:PepSY-associated TM helix domain-containing protein n=1 Tax=Acinetobacter rudis TaxID=632955 RepID=UPI0033422752